MSVLIVLWLVCTGYREINKKSLAYQLDRLGLEEGKEGGVIS